VRFTLVPGKGLSGTLRLPNPREVTTLHTNNEVALIPQHLTEEGTELCARFILGKRIGNPGRTAEAVEATDKLTNVTVVCKIAGLETSRQSVLAEYHKLRSARSPGVCEALGYFEHEHNARKFPLLVLERIDGPTLDQWKEGKSTRQRIETLLQAAKALAALHRADLAHGDLHPKNIIVADERVVLIDPNADEFGPMPERSEPRGPATTAEDLYDFAGNLRLLLNGFENTTLKALIGKLEGPLAGRPSAQDVAITLETILHACLIEGGLAIDLGNWRRRDEEERREQFHRVRMLRDLFWRLLADKLKELTASVDCTLTETIASEDLELEKVSHSQPRSFLAKRIFECTSPDADRWEIRFEECKGIRRPWPNDTPNLIARGNTVVHFHSTTMLNEAIELWLVNNQPLLVRLAVGDMRLGADDKWLNRCFRLLLGGSFAAITAPVRVGRPKKPISSFPLDSRTIEDGELAIENNGLAIRLMAFKQQLRLFLSTPLGSQSHDRSYGSTIHQILDVGDGKISRILQEVVLQELSVKFGEYLDTIIAFDVQINNKARQIDVFTELVPFGGDAVSWNFEIQFPNRTS
jgi:tRNA A-37 threonylcarbamoyl transferase component Bud32